MILGFKGFKPGLIATLGDGSYQYQPGEVSKTEKAKCANTGFHYCLDPLDCLNWYAWDGKADFWAKDIRDVFIRIEILNELVEEGSIEVSKRGKYKRIRICISGIGSVVF